MYGGVTREPHAPPDAASRRQRHIDRTDEHRDRRRARALAELDRFAPAAHPAEAREVLPRAPRVALAACALLERRAPPARFGGVIVLLVLLERGGDCVSVCVVAPL